MNFVNFQIAAYISWTISERKCKFLRDLCKENKLRNAYAAVDLFK